jgi:hypothetical protein
VSRYVVHRWEKDMEWTKPEFVEINMDTEVGRYQEDDGRP